MPEQIWFKDPSILFMKDTWSKFVPLQDMSTAEALNSVVRFTVYFSVLLFFATGVSAYILSIPIIMVATILLYNMFPNGKTLEPFNVRATRKAGHPVMPTPDNPFMNVLLTDIVDDPNREDAAPITRGDVKAAIAKSFQKTRDMYMDTTDMFDQAQAMRTFHTLQSARVPNDQDAFLKWMTKGHDEPDYSSAPPARGAKILNEGHVVAKGSTRDLPSSTTKPTGTSPSTAPARPAK